MNDIIKVNFDSEIPTVSARELYKKLNIESNFTTWFKRMCEYGFAAGKDFFPKKEESTGGRPAIDFDVTIRCGKEICMIQRTDIGRKIRNYFLDLEDAWNSPEQVYARALKMADKTIHRLTTENQLLTEDIERMKPKEIFSDAVSTSHTSILVGDLAKILKQNGFDIGATRLFERLRTEGYLIRRKGSDWNMPTQKSMEMGLFEIKETTSVNPDGSTRTNKTPKVTGKGQIYFVNRYIGKEKKGKLQCEEK